MSVLSMVALRMVTQEGLRKCLKIYEELKKKVVEKSSVPLAATSTMTPAPNLHDVKSPASSKSAKRRSRRRKLKESRRDEEITKMMEEKSTKEPCQGDDKSVDVAPYNLVTHADRRTSKDFLERSLMAAFLLKCLQRVGFFACPASDDGTYHQPLYTRNVRSFSRGLYLTFTIIYRIASSRERREKNVLARAESELSIQQILRAAWRSVHSP